MSNLINSQKVSNKIFFTKKIFFQGVAYVNGFNLGRYWPSMGPQKNLFVPRYGGLGLKKCKL